MTRSVFARGSHAEQWEVESDIESLAAEGHEEATKRHRKVRVYVCRITPALAELMLETNIRNRRARDRHVDVLSQIISSRDMMLNGESIIFSSDGHLLDGQHRLMACIRSGMAFDSVVVFGISPKAFNTIDAGVARSTGDVLGLSGRANANKMASAVQALVAFVDNNGVLHCSCAHSGVRKATPALAERVLAAHPGLAESVNAMDSNRLMRGQHGYVLHYLFGLVDKPLAAEFAEVMSKGSVDIGRPFSRLREHLIAMPMTPDRRATCSAKAIIAFNAERSGARPKIFRVGSVWPTIDGLDFDGLARSIK